ncbi:hypothetical protein BKA93DRAFT_823325 [Sparassis latifolia]|uniref:Glucose receptor Git3 N-terminal domain-containing protein n=1 Tax=Sparassis crispa TaxID=139825 RepID=A0A401H2E2_9APHY|nr:hypothetical protein SCP_1303460 [Sparassis crispa]GBE88530.1 hypothetical protein SCP_1303460 [Sparassis crispa]
MSTQQVLVLYQPGQASALIAIVVFAILSILAIAFVPLRSAWVYVRAIVFRRKFKENPTEYRYQEQRFFFSTQLGAYTASMLCGNFLSSLAFALDSEWVRRRAVERDSICMAQGALGQVGHMATAFFTATVAVHSFNSLVLRNRLPRWACVIVLLGGWITAVVVGIVPAVVSGAVGPVFSYDGLSCGVAWQYPAAQIILLLVPLFISALCSVVFYVLIFLVLRGTLVFKNGLKFHLDPEVRRSVLDANGTPLQYQRFIAAVVKSMLCLPIAYLALLIWYIIVVLLQASGKSVSFGFQVFASTMRAMLGLANVLIVLNTMRILSPHLKGRSDSSKSKREADMESFYVPSKSPPFTSPSEKTPPVPRLTLSAPSPASSGGSDSGRLWIPPVDIPVPRPASHASTINSMTVRNQAGPSLPSSPRAGLPSQPPSFGSALRIPEPAFQKTAQSRDSARWSNSLHVDVPLPGRPSPPHRPVRPPTSPHSRNVPPVNANTSVDSNKPNAPTVKRVAFDDRESKYVQEIPRVTSPLANTPASLPGSSAGFRSSPAFARTFNEANLLLSPLRQARQSPAPRTVGEEVHTAVSPRSKPVALSSSAWAALVAGAATSRSPLPVSPQVLASGRHSRSIDLPRALRPRLQTPMSAGVASSFREPYPRPIQSAKPSAYATRSPDVVVRDGPRSSRTSVALKPDLVPSTSRTSSTRPYGYI